MKKYPICVACGKEIERRKEFRIGNIQPKNWLLYRPFHKECFREFKVEGKYFEIIYKNNSFKRVDNYLWKKQKNLNILYTKLWYSFGFYSLNDTKHWVFVPLLSFGLILWFKKLFGNHLFYYLLLLFILFGIFYEIVTLLRFQTDYNFRK